MTALLPLSYPPLARALITLLLIVCSPPLHSSASFGSGTGADLLSNAPASSFLPVDAAYVLDYSREPDQLTLRWTIAAGYFLYGHNLSVSIDGAPATLSLPPATLRQDEYYEEEVPVYFHSLQLQIALPAGATTVAVNYQGCAEAGLCYPPQTKILPVSGTSDTPTNPASTIAAASTADNHSTATSGNPDTGAGINLLPLLSAMALALLGGTILNLMPCVFPVLSLKALSLANSTSAAGTRRHGWSYTAGSVLTFTLIAALLYSARSAGEAVGWGFQLQSPLVIGALVYLFFTMGLSLSNILQLRMPWTNLGNDLTRGHSLKASFFTGALASIVASPCTAPFMGAALGFAMTQPPATGLLVFAALGLGMALPFLLLSHLPQLHRHLPKPGPWMESLKQALAFPLFFTAVWLLWVLGHQAGTDALSKLLSGLTLLALGAWLLRPERNPRSKLWRHALSLGAAVAALSLLPGTSAAPANPAASDGTWQTYSRARLDELRAAGEPVFVNLTADWCITCKANEKFALNTATVNAAFQRAGIHRLKGDWTNPDAEISALLTEFGRSGVPLYLFYPPGNTRPTEILPQLLTENILLERIDSIKNNN